MHTVYKEEISNDPLLPFVECFWTVSLSNGADAAALRIIPDGCIDIFIDIAGQLQVSGPRTSTHILALPKGKELNGVRLKRGTATLLLGTSARELTDCIIKPEELWHIHDQQPDSTAHPWELLRKFLCNRSSFIKSMPNPVVLAATKRLQDNPGIHINVLAKEIGVSARQLLRLFDHEIGFGPKMLARIFRLQRLLASSRRNKQRPTNWSNIAYEAGYSDQSHMIHETRSLTGVLPSQLF